MCMVLVKGPYGNVEAKQTINFLAIDSLHNFVQGMILEILQVDN